MEKTHWDPKRIVLPPSSKSSPISTERGQQPMTYNASAEGGNSIASAGNDKGDVAASSAPGLAKPGVRPTVTARRPSLRRTRPIPSRAFPRSARPRLSKISPSTKERTSHDRTVASPKDPSHRSLEPRPKFTGVDNSTSVHGAKTFSEPPKALPFRTGGTYHNISEGMWPIDKVCASD
ncbi:hypothetical protein BC827DRAFT_106985 [Russula dissimulans]|nr:hypothetical protein BC827DRAFT_106985 [Russula dissimulans]